MSQTAIGEIGRTKGTFFFLFKNSKLIGLILIRKTPGEAGYFIKVIFVFVQGVASRVKEYNDMFLLLKV